MAEKPHELSSSGLLTLDRARVDVLMDCLERMAAGDFSIKAPISPARDELDAFAHGINVLVQELDYQLKQLKQAQLSLIQSAKLAALGEVCSGLAHELNNPLAIIRGFVENSQRQIEPDSPKSKDLNYSLSRIDDCVERMSRIIRHVLDFSRQSQPSKKPLSINEPVRNALMLLQEQLRLQNIEIQLELGPDALLTSGDSMRLEQVFMNLLTNSRDAISEARGALGGKIRLRSDLGKDGKLEAEVADNGAGMTEEALDKMFQPFFTTKPVGKGMGLGLSISLGIVQEHDGEILCESERGKGTRMRIRLPALETTRS